MRDSVKLSLFALPVSLGLFFGLFFGLVYQELARHGWPLTKCTILDAKIDTRYCCETKCNMGCATAPSGAPTCSSQVSSVNNGFSPGKCAANSSACPTVTGSTCDGGYYCCSQCCDTCQTCTNSCSGNPPTCSQSCSSHSCNCRCCDQTSRRSCIVECPTCYFVDLSVTFYAGRLRNQPQNTTYHQDFGKNQGDAERFYQSHLTNTTTSCYYNPQSLSEVLFDVSLTPWKWVVTSLFGFLPLFLNICAFVVIFWIIPMKVAIQRLCQRFRRRVRRRSRPEVFESREEPVESEKRLDDRASEITKVN